MVKPLTFIFECLNTLGIFLFDPELFEPFVFSHYFLNSERKYVGHIRFQDESTNVPNETLLYFIDYFNTCRAVYPGENVLFPPVKTEG